MEQAIANQQSNPADSAKGYDAGLPGGSRGTFRDRYKFDAGEIFAVALVFLVALGFYQFPQKSTLPDFTFAIQVQSALSGGAAPLAAHAAAAIHAAHAAVAGVAASEPQLLVSTLLFLPSLSLAIIAALFFLSARNFGFGRPASALVALLFCFSLASLEFLPGVFGNLQLSAVLFSLFLLCFSFFASKRSHLMLLPSLAFAALSAYASPEFGIAGALFTASYAVPTYIRKEKTVAQLVLIPFFAAGALLSPDFALMQLRAGGIGDLLELAPFLLAPASCAIAFRQRQEYALWLASAFAAALFSPLAGALLLALPAAWGATQAMQGQASSRAKTVCAFALAFFALFGLAIPFFGMAKAALVSLLLSSLFPLMLHFYEYSNARMFAGFFTALLLVSFFFSVFYQLPPAKERMPQYFDSDMASELSRLSKSGASQIHMLGSPDAARFYLPGAKLASQDDFLSYLSTGAPKIEPGSRLALSLSYLDGGLSSSGGFEAYSFVGNISSPDRAFALFASPSGLRLVREVSSSGQFVLRDADLVDSSGRAYSTVPLSRMMMLSPSLSIYDESNRLVVLEEGAVPPYVAGIYSGRAQGLSLESRTGKVSVYRAD